MSKTLMISNWQKWQTYRNDRGTPPWIKVHRNLLSNPEWAILTDSEKGQLVSIWIIAADKNGEIPSDPKILQKIAQLDNEPNINKFISLGFVTPSGCQVDAKVTPSGCQVDAPETETETETEKNRVDKTLVAETIVSTTINCPHEKIINMYHEILPMCTKIKIWTDTRKKILQTRWREDPEHQTLEFWGWFFDRVRQSNFLTGKVQTGERKPFVADLPWLIKLENFAKVIEGKYR